MLILLASELRENFHEKEASVLNVCFVNLNSLVGTNGLGPVEPGLQR
jgi:hypothetical protein